MSADAAILPEDPALLKAMIAALQADNARMSATIRAHDQLIQVLRLRIAKLKKQAFGKSSEKVEREIEQLELALEDLLIAAAEGVRLSGRPNDRQFESGHVLSLSPLRTWRRRRDMMKLNELPPISADEVARFLAISSRSVRRLVDRGALQPTRIGGYTAFRWPDVLRCAGVERDVTTRETLAPLVTPQQAAERLGCAPETVRAAIARGDLPPIRIGSLLRLRIDNVARFNTDGGTHAPRE